MVSAAPPLHAPITALHVPGIPFGQTSRNLVFKRSVHPELAAKQQVQARNGMMILLIVYSQSV